MKFGVLGTGQVGQTIALKLQTNRINKMAIASRPWASCLGLSSDECTR